MKKFLLMCSVMISISLYGENFDLKTLSQKTIHIENFDGNFIFNDPVYQKQQILFFFFGTRCPFCEKEIPEIIKLVKNTNLKVIGIQAQAKIDDILVEDFAVNKNINFEILHYVEGVKLVKYLTQKRMWVGGVPYYVLVDKYGNLEPLDFNEVMKTLN